MTIAIAIIENKYNAQEFYFFPLTKGRIKSILKVPKRNFRNNTNRDLKPQKDKNSIFYATAYKKTNTINQEKQKTQIKTPNRQQKRSNYKQFTGKISFFIFVTEIGTIQI
ncbi:hypothetical protein Q9K79_001426 [Escherichia coli]|nr:hypothetical protein [Escherichia coli]